MVMNRVGSNMFGEVIKLKMTMDIIWVIMYIELGETDLSIKVKNLGTKCMGVMIKPGTYVW